MAWYAPPEPPWDVCWDFAKGASKKGGGKGKGGGGGWKSQSWGNSGWGESSGGGGGGWNAGPSQASGGQTMPPWWGMQQPFPQAGPWAMPPWTQSPAALAAMTHTPLKKPSDSGEPAIPAFLEKRFAERRGAAPVPQVYQPPVEKVYEGSLKSISAKHGYGFVVCEEAHRIYGRDVYLPKDAVPEGVKALDRLRFNLCLSPKGHPQARNCSAVSLTAPENTAAALAAEENEEAP